MVIRALALCLSFSGLCAGLRALLKLDRFIAPFTAASSIIALLMLGGMLQILEPVFWLLYTAGFVGLIYAYRVKKIRPQYGLYILMMIFCVLLILRYYDCKLTRNDEISHWGLVARHLLRYDAFPDSRADYVFFQSYPLGTASLIYYIGKTIANTEYIYFIAQNFLLGTLFLPILSLVSDERNAKRICFPIVALVFVFLFNTSRFLQSLQVDIHLGFFGIGMSAVILRYRKNWKHALVAVAPALGAVVYIKNSGLFFAALCSIGIGRIACKSGLSRKKSTLLGAGTLSASVLFYGFWVLHTKLAYPAAQSTKHAVSLSTYSQQMQEKGLDTILAIGRRLINELLRFSGAQVLVAAAMLAIGLILLFGCLRIPGQRSNLRPVMMAYTFNVCVYLLWVLLIYLMYIFSMPTVEALRTASFFRYNGTGLALLLGCSTILLIWWLNQSEIYTMRIFTWASRLCCVCIAGFFFIAALFYSGNAALNANENMREIFARDTQHLPARVKLMTAVNDGVLPTHSRTLIYSHSIHTDNVFNLYLVKHELESGDLHMVGQYKDQGAKKPYRVGTVWENRDVDDYSDYLSQTLPSCSAVVMMHPSEEFETQLRSCMARLNIDLPVVYAY